MVRRTRFELYSDVLRVIGRGIKKPTRIMYKANLTYNTLREILKVLIEHEFIGESTIKGNKRYHITNKGKNVLLHNQKHLEMAIPIKLNI